jgi:hypothetical protein
MAMTSYGSNVVISGWKVFIVILLCPGLHHVGEPLAPSSLTHYSVFAKEQGFPQDTEIDE